MPQGPRIRKSAPHILCNEKKTKPQPPHKLSLRCICIISQKKKETEKEEDEEKAKKQGATNVHSMYKYVIFGIYMSTHGPLRSSMGCAWGLTRV